MSLTEFLGWLSLLLPGLVIFAAVLLVLRVAAPEIYRLIEGD